MTGSKGASILFTKDEEVVKGASWHQLTKARNRQKLGLIHGEHHTVHPQVHQTTEEGDNPLKVLEEKIREEKIKEEKGVHEHISRTHQVQLPEKEIIENDSDEFEDDLLPPSFRSSMQSHGD
jgi:hypothetical protein